MGKDAYFLRLVQTLEDWYADSVKATDVRPVGTGTQPLGHQILQRQKYPGPDWRGLWRAACGDTVAQDELIAAVEDEIYAISHGPSKASPASGLHKGTEEWRRAVAAADGSLRAIARQFGISHVEVWRIKKKYNGKDLTN